MKLLASIDSYLGLDRIQKSNTRTPNPLKKIVLAPTKSIKKGELTPKVTLPCNPKPVHTNYVVHIGY